MEAHPKTEVLMTRLICCFALSAIALFGDVTGKWTGTGKSTGGDGDDHTMTLNMELKQTGNDVTGSVMTGDSGDRYNLAGMLDGDVLNFKVEADAATYVVKLTVKEDHMTGEANASRGDGKMTIKLDFKRGI
jgi:hypothetical protein